MSDRDDIQQPSEPTLGPDQSRFTEPSEEVKRRNRITGWVILFLVLTMIAIGMIVRVYG